jgi:F-box protein, helicase, 18
MNLTDQQKDIISSTGNIKINAVAGSGKTTTVIEYAKSRPPSSKKLYLAYNKTVKEEAIKKFSRQRCENITVETVHSLAYKNIVIPRKYNLRHEGYSISDLVQMLNIGGSPHERFLEYMIANHVSNLTWLFCNSDIAKIQEFPYMERFKGHEDTSNFLNSYYDVVLAYAIEYLKQMYTGAIPITHDFYLKLFQLSKPNLGYDYILFDEGQDASPTMLSIFLNQGDETTKVIVGDTHQQIYAWREAINSLESVTGYSSFDLTNSFRFDQNIANLAMNILDFKEYINPEEYKKQRIHITGSNESSITNNNNNSYAVLARGNLGLLQKAIELIIDEKKTKRIHFEGNISSYTYASDGASLYDILNLKTGKKDKIRDPIIKKMRGTPDLNEYIEKAGDIQLKIMLDIVNTYGNDIYNVFKKLKEYHVPTEQKDTADIIFSTVHKSKGMEYNEVELSDDFISENLLVKLSNMDDKAKRSMSDTRIIEEINLFYVAITRTLGSVRVPKELLPYAHKPNNKVISV